MLDVFEVLHFGVTNDTLILGGFLLSTLNWDVQLLNQLAYQNWELKIPFDSGAGSNRPHVVDDGPWQINVINALHPKENLI